MTVLQTEQSIDYQGEPSNSQVFEIANQALKLTLVEYAVSAEADEDKKLDLSRAAHRLVDLIEQNPAFSDEQTLRLVAQASDGIGDHSILEKITEIYRLSDNRVNQVLGAIAISLEQDIPFAKAMEDLNSQLDATIDQIDRNHSDGYEFLHSKDAERPISNITTARVNISSLDELFADHVKKPKLSQQFHS